jgi:hypothetical protein
MDALAGRIRKALLAIDGVQLGESVFSEGEAFWVNGKQVAHYMSDGHMEIRLTKPMISANRTRLKADPRVELRRNASDWLIVRYGSAKDVPLISELAGIAVAAHRAPAGSPVKPPPTGADLARRRRFH